MLRQMCSLRWRTCVFMAVSVRRQKLYSSTASMQILLRVCSSGAGFFFFSGDNSDRRNTCVWVIHPWRAAHTLSLILMDEPATLLSSRAEPVTESSACFPHPVIIRGLKQLLGQQGAEDALSELRGLLCRRNTDTESFINLHLSQCRINITPLCPSYAPTKQLSSTPPPTPLKIYREISGDCWVNMLACVPVEPGPNKSITSN